MRVPTLIALFALGACGPASAAQTEVGGGASGTIHVSDAGTGMGQFVMRWHSRRGNQRAVAVVSLSPVFGYELTVTLHPTGGEERRLTGNPEGLGVDARAVCTHRTCDMEAIATIRVKNPEAVGTVNWSALLQVEPVDPLVDLTDFTVEVLDADGGVVSR